MAQGLMNLRDDLCYVKSVGPKRAELFRKLGLLSVYDLLHFFPRRYLDLTQPKPVAEVFYNETAAVIATVTAPARGVKLRPGMEVYKTTAADATGQFDLVFFNRRFAAQALKPGETYLFYGKMTGNFRHEMVNPHYQKPIPCILPVYPTTVGLPQSAIRTAVRHALDGATDAGEVIDADLRRVQGLCSRAFALQNIHRPTSFEALQQARKRLAFEELLIFSLALAGLRQKERCQTDIRLNNIDMSPFYDALGFRLTDAQQRVISECLSDYATPYAQNRLIQGDVGSGKTAVAAALIYYIVKNRYQAALMAPTEVLAQQHYASLSKLFAPLGVRCALLTGSTSQKERKPMLAALAAGEIDLLIGTHALITDKVQFKKLGLVIADEQHRFGVAQREALTRKGARPHVVVMSATPIPRTLALILYADLDVSQIDELPAGRKPIATYAVGRDLRERLYGFVKKQVQAGHQAYVICARAEEDEQSELASVKELCEELRTGFLSGLRVDYVYGKMGAKKKEAVLQAFYRGELDALVSTTVVEVGVNVPNATAMVIENAERFGLSQLHQLRGRIGRGSEQSYCILVSDSDTERLAVMTQTNDGFQISREDLKLRGPGEFFGTRQSGLVRFRIADLMDDMQTLITARDAAERILAQDPTLTAAEHRALREAVRDVIRQHNQTI